MEYRNLAVELMDTMIRASSCKSKRILNEMVKGERFIICYLYSHERTLPGEIAQEMHTTTAHVAKILRGLDERGFVTRELDVKDRRRILVSLTEAGKKEAQIYVENMLGLLEQALRHLGEEDASEYVRITKKLQTIYETIYQKEE